MTAAGVWTLVGTVTLGIVAILARFLPRWRELGIGEKKDIEARLSARITALEAKVDKWMKAAISAHAQLTPVTSALALVTAELERKDPQNPVLKQSRELVKIATHRDEAFGALIAQLDEIEEDSE